MASIKFIVKGRKIPSHFYVRFYHSKEFDITLKTGLLINPNHWNNRLQRFKTLAEDIPNKEETIKHIEELKNHILSEHNKSYTQGETIDKHWLQNIINRFNKRPKNGNDFEIYFVPFIKNWIEESKSRVNITSGKIINDKTIKKYNTTLKRLQEFEEEYKTKLKHSDIGLDFHGKFISYLVKKEYGNSTIEKYISQIKTFCREAEVKDYNINPEFKSRRFTYRRSKPLDPYLSTEEIQLIYDLEISDPEKDKFRDLFIIGLWTGLRISDFKELDRLQIQQDTILISSTKKTSAPARIPIHPQVRKILDKRKGELPKFALTPTALEVKFNKVIKEICFDAGIREKIIGDKRDKDKNRNIRGIYPKNELVSSHICRRSFVTNHYGKIPNQAIMAITTHTSEKQLLDYVKISRQEYIEIVKEHWKQEESKNLKIVS